MIGYILSFLLVLSTVSNTLFDWGVLSGVSISIIQVVIVSSLLGLILRLKSSFSKNIIGGLVLFGLTVIISILYNRNLSVEGLKEFRYLIAPILCGIFISILNLSGKSKDIVLRGLVLFSILHVCLAIIKRDVLNLHYETSLGLIEHSATVYLALLVWSTSSLISRFRGSYKLLWLIGILIISLAGGKRISLVILPLFLMVDLALDKVKFLKIILLTVLLGLPGIYIMARSFPTLNPEAAEWGTFNLAFILEYMFEYESVGRIGDTGLTVGRIGTTLLVLNQALSSVPQFMLGNGIMSFDDGILANQGIEYGLNGFSYLMMQFGLLGVLTYFLLLKRIVNMLSLNHRKRKYFLLVIILMLFYSPEFKNLPLMIFYFLILKVYDVKQKELRSADNWT